MIHNFWLICVGMAALLGIAVYQPAIGLFFMRTGRKKSPLALRTIFVFLIGLSLGAAAYSFVEPHGSFFGVSIAACVAALVLIVPWTALVLVPRRKGVSPWPLLGKGLLWGPLLGAVFGGVCAALDQEPAGPLVAGAAIFGLVFGPWTAAAAWADKLGVFGRGSKVKGAVDSSPHDAGVDPE